MVCKCYLALSLIFPSYPVLSIPYPLCADRLFYFQAGGSILLRISLWPATTVPLLSFIPPMGPGIIPQINSSSGTDNIKFPVQIGFHFNSDEKIS